MNQNADFQIPMFYGSSQLGQEVLLYEGGLGYPDGDSLAALTGNVFVQWLPFPRIGYRIWDEEAAPLSRIERFLEGSVGGQDDEDHLLPSIDPKQLSPSTALPQPIPSGVSYRAEGWFSNRIEIGEPHALAYARFNLINFLKVMGSSVTAAGHGLSRNRLTFQGEGWTLLIDSLGDPTFEFLKRTGGYAFTHVAQIQRTDGSTFTWDVELEGWLWRFLQFVGGRKVGIAVPVGFGSSDTPKWANWSITIVDPWAGALTWADPVSPKEVERLFPLFMSRWRDRFWQIVLNRTIAYYLEGNVGPLEKAIIMTQAGLELLAWTVLVEDPVNSSPLSSTAADKLRASGRIDKVLNWANISAAIPSEQTALLKWAGTAIGPLAFTRLRNALTHASPTKPRPPHGAMVEAWLLGSYWLELLILRICDFNGQFHSRLQRGGWAGSVEGVPWGR